MTSEIWNITLVIARFKQGGKPFAQSFPLTVDPDEYVLDAVERIWAFQDRGLVFRHACHHSTCGACGMRVNGEEKLTCITPIRAMVKNGGTLKLEPLRNFPIISDLSVDMASLYAQIEKAPGAQVVPVEKSALPYEKNLFAQDGLEHERLADCIECGLCVSACPVALTDPAYAGPAALAAAHQAVVQGGISALPAWVDSAEGVWRCHSGYECSAVCPSNVDPAWRIMDLRKQVILRRIQRIFGLVKD
jgi:succinate dehydrogenase / fumarate reductase iron-sulfur subunit